MIKFLAVVFVCLAFTAATAQATGKQRIVWRGVHCSNGNGVRPGVVCIRSDEQGYAVFFSKRSVQVYVTRTARLVFYRDQPN
jgi:hypothetical protein